MTVRRNAIWFAVWTAAALLNTIGWPSLMNVFFCGYASAMAINSFLNILSGDEA